MGKIEKKAELTICDFDLKWFTIAFRHSTVCLLDGQLSLLTLVETNEADAFAQTCNISTLISPLFSLENISDNFSLLKYQEFTVPIVEPITILTIIFGNVKFVLTGEVITQNSGSDNIAIRSEEVFKFPFHPTFRNATDVKVGAFDSFATRSSLRHLEERTEVIRQFSDFVDQI